MLAAGAFLSSHSRARRHCRRLAPQPPAGQSFATATDAQKAVAVVNGETITVERLDRMWRNMNTQMRKQ